MIVILGIFFYLAIGNAYGILPFKNIVLQEQCVIITGSNSNVACQFTSINDKRDGVLFAKVSFLSFKLFRLV